MMQQTRAHIHKPVLFMMSQTARHKMALLTATKFLDQMTRQPTQSLLKCNKTTLIYNIQQSNDNQKVWQICYGEKT